MPALLGLAGAAAAAGPPGRSFVDRLVDELLADKARFAPAASAAGYRNKMTYTLHPAFSMSELGQPEVSAASFARRRRRHRAMWVSWARTGLRPAASPRRRR